MFMHFIFNRSSGIKKKNELDKVATDKFEVNRVLSGGY